MLFYVVFSRTLLTSAASPGASRSFCVALTECLLKRLDSTVKQNCSSVIDLNTYQGMWRKGDSTQLEHIRVNVDMKLDFQLTNAPETRSCVAAKLRSMRFFKSEMFESIDAMYPDELNTDIIFWFVVGTVCMLLIVCIREWQKTIESEKALLVSARAKKTTPMRSKPSPPAESESASLVTTS